MQRTQTYAAHVCGHETWTRKQHSSSMLSGVQAQAAHETHTNVEEPENPEGVSKGPATKRQHFIVMRHGERIDEVSPVIVVLCRCCT